MQEPIVNDAARTDGRGPTELRPVSIQRGFVEYAEGSCLLTMGQTRIICAASVEDGVPGWLRGKGKGWVTAEYRMLPRATLTRTPRETNRIGGRTHEIQRLIGRSLRSVVDLTALGERTVWVDCDVLQADGGTRTASVTGAMVALYDALRAPGKAGRPAVHPVTEFVAAVSVGLVGNFPVLDLCYGEDVSAGVDMNVVMTEGGRFVEVQGTAEGEPFTREALDTLLDLAARGVRELVAAQKAALGV